MVTIAFTGDSHHSAGTAGRLGETERIHGFMVDDWAERGVQLAIHGGDLFHKPDAADFVERVGARRFVQRATESAPVLLIDGNHDPTRELLELQHLRTLHAVHVAATPSCYTVGDLLVQMLPWPTRSGLLAGDPTAWQGDPEVEPARAALRAILTGLGLEATAHRERGGAVILAGHAMVRGARAGAHGQPLIGDPMEVRLEDLMLARPDAVLLAHVHKPQAWECVRDGGHLVSSEALEEEHCWAGGLFNVDGPSVPVIYAGSPTRRTFGENERKGYVLVTIRDGQLTWERIETPCRPMHLLDATWVADTQALTLPSLDPLGFGDYDWRDAEVRLRGAVPPEHRERCKAQARTWADEVRERGAALVVEDITTLVERRVRSVAVDNAEGLESKLAAYWDERDPDLNPDRHGSMLARVREWLRGLPEPTAAEDGAPALEWNRVRGRGLGKLVEFDVDFDALAGPLVGVSGKNGSCKTTFIGAAIAATHRRVPFYGSFASMAQTRDAFVELHGVGRFPFVARQFVDSKTKKGESFAGRLVEGRGPVPLLTDSKVKTFDEWSAREMPSLPAMLASTFSEQRSQPFLQMSPAKRRDLVLHELRLSSVEFVAGQARAEADKLRDAVSDMESRIAEERREIEPTGTDEAIERVRGIAADAMMLAETALEEATEQVRITEQVGSGARDAALEYQTKWTAHQQAVTARNRASESARECVESIDRTRAKIRQAEQVIEAAAGAEAARVRVVELTAQIDALNDTVRQEQEAGLAASRRIEAAVPTSSQRQAVSTAEYRVQELGRTLLDRGRVAAAVADLPVQQAALEAADAASVVASREVERLRELNEAPNALRVAVLRPAVDDIAGGVDEDRALEVAEDAIMADDRIQTGAATASTELAAAVRVKREAISTQTQAVTGAAAAAALAKRKPAIDAAAAELEQAETRLAEVRQVVATAETAAKHIGDERDEHRRAATLATAKAGPLTGDRATERQVAQRAEEAAKAQAAKTVADATLAELTTRLATAQDDRDAVQVPPDPGEPPTTARELDERLEQDRQNRGRCESDLATARSLVATWTQRWQRVQELETQTRETEAELADVERIAIDCGRKGLQQLVVDGALPALTQHANDLLEACLGDRFRLEFVTEREYASQTGRDDDDLMECFEVWVHDAGDADNAPRPERAKVTEFSGGEQALFSEIIALALTVLSCERAGVRDFHPTLVRDETGSELDAAMSVAYVHALRRAAKILHASRVLIVSHKEEVLALCDSLLVCGGGTVTAMAPEAVQA